VTIKDIVEKTTQHFKQKGFPTARLDAELLFGHALKMKRTELYINFEKPLSDPELEACREVVRRRAAGEPVAYICGSRDFYKSTFFVGPGVLIPRPDTEVLVEVAVEWIKKNHPDGHVEILDLGAGTGCISLSLAKEFPNSQVSAVEKSENAAEYFEKNKLGLQADNATLIRDDVATHDFAGKKFDVVVSNPPYISESDINVDLNVKKYEPFDALFSSDNGLSDIKTWAAIAAKLLKSGGLCVFEIGATQGSEVERIFNSLGVFTNIKILPDYSHYDRAISASRL
jgi:release factor glutamine methyltransferase